jgi:hypothetical protein
MYAILDTSGRNARSKHQGVKSWQSSSSVTSPDRLTFSLPFLATLATVPAVTIAGTLSVTSLSSAVPATALVRSTTNLRYGASIETECMRHTVFSPSTMQHRTRWWLSGRLGLPMSTRMTFLRLSRTASLARRGRMVIPVATTRLSSTTSRSLCSRGTFARRNASRVAHKGRIH